jgi:very-short-patch-repair endonuclease
VIELGGSVHNQYEQNDLGKGRTETLNEFGIKVLRFNNEEILNDIENVILKTQEVIV